MRKNCPLITGATGFGILAVGALSSWYLFPFIVNSQIHKNIDLREGTQAYDFWKEQPFPLKFKIYFFNVSNPHEVQNGGKPILKEIGPYVYDEFRIREHIAVDENRDTLKYVLKKTFFFNKTDSGCHDPDDYVTILNAALVGTALQVEAMLSSALATVSDAIPYLYPGAKDIFMTAKVKDILFDGIRLYCQDPEVEFVCGAMKGALPKTIHVAENGVDFLFSMFGHLNGTDDGPWEMGRGLKNSTRGEVYMYENQEDMDIWGDQYCNMINGSDSTVFVPVKSLHREPRIYTFAQDFCRSLYASYEKETTQFGLSAIRYSSKPESLARSEENKCFCPTVTDDDGNDQIECPPSGLADITPCFKAPVMISYPHFYLADPKLLNDVIGLNPQKELHENFVNLEPRTATPLSGKKRVQINIQVKPLEDFKLLENVSSYIHPVLWIEEGVTLPDDIANMLVQQLGKIALLDMFKWVLITSGIGTMLAAFVLVMKKEKLMCFGNNTTVDITTNGHKEHRQGEVNRGFELNTGLYPQLDNKNTTEQFANRNRTQHEWNANAWSREN